MFTLLTILPACDLIFGRNDASDGPYCEDTPTVLALDEVSELGFSGQDMLDLAEGTFTEDLRYQLDPPLADTIVAVDVAYDAGEVRFIHSEAVYPETNGPTNDIGVVCWDRMEVDVDVSLYTDDTLFAEDWDGVTLEAASESQVELYRSLDSFGGPFDLWDYADPDADEVRAFVEIRFDADGSHGALSGQASGADDCEPGETCAAWAETIDIASWSSLEDEE